MDKALYQQYIALLRDGDGPAAASLSVDGVLDFARCLEQADGQALFQAFASFDPGFSPTDLAGDGGQDIVAKLIQRYGGGVAMDGCDLAMAGGAPGLGAVLPVLAYAQALAVEEGRLFQALAISRLVAIQIQNGIGCLSAFCLAVSGAAGNAAAIAFLRGGSGEQICNAISNTLSSLSGLVCDGELAACANKAYQGLECAVLAAELALKNAAGQGSEAGWGCDIAATMAQVRRLQAEAGADEN